MIKIDQQNEKTYRDVCLVDNKPVVLADHRSIGPDPLGTRANVADREFNVSTSVDDLSQPIRGIVHISATPEAYAADLFLDAHRNNPPQTVLLQVSTAEAVGGDHLAGDPIVWLLMKDRSCYRQTSDWLPQFLNLSFDDAVKIAEAKDRGALAPGIQEGYEKLLDITHPGDPTAPLAFRFLCEAWKEVNITGNTELSGFPINAPTILAEWLAPFVPDGIDDPAKIASVVSKMGDAGIKERVAKVLNTVNGNGVLRDQVLALLGINDETTTQTEGGDQ